MKLTLPKAALILSLVLLIFLVGFFWFFNNYTYFKNSQIHFGKPLLVVKGIALDEDDYKVQERLDNGQKRFQQGFDKNVKLSSRQEVLDDLVKVTKMEVGARDLGIYPSQNEINNKKTELTKIEGGEAKMAARNKSFGWSDSDFNRSATIELLKDKLNDKVVLWREVEYVALRFDILPIKTPDLTYYKPKAIELLTVKEDEFKMGTSTKQIASELKADKAVTNVFSSAIGYSEHSSNPLLRRLQRVTKDKTLELDKHVLELKVGEKADLWCTDSACYLTRVLAGSNGNYKNLEEWVTKQ